MGLGWLSIAEVDWHSEQYHFRHYILMIYSTPAKKTTTKKNFLHRDHCESELPLTSSSRNRQASQLLTTTSLHVKGLIHDWETEQLEQSHKTHLHKMRMQLSKYLQTTLFSNQQGARRRLMKPWHRDHQSLFCPVPSGSATDQQGYSGKLGDLFWPFPSNRMPGWPLTTSTSMANPNPSQRKPLH